MEVTVVFKRNLRLMISLYAIFVVTLMLTPSASAQNVASQKAYFGFQDYLIASIHGDVVAQGLVKTSGVGDLLIGFSMECTLATTTVNSAKKGGGKSTSTSRAAVNVTVYVDDQEAAPGQVVYCDRLQQVELEFLSDDTINFTNDEIVLKIFQETKSAHHFNFYYENPGSAVHLVQVVVNKDFTGTDPAVSDGTRAMVGKRTLAIEEYDNP